MASFAKRSGCLTTYRLGVCLAVCVQVAAMLMPPVHSYTNVRQLSKLATAKYILTHHNSSEFAFLDADMRIRTQYYGTICRILFVEEVSEQEFAEFMAPFTAKVEMLARLATPAHFMPLHVQVQATHCCACAPSMRVSGNDTNTCAPVGMQTMVNGLCRDLRGMATVITTRRNFLLLWEWLYPDRLAVLLCALEAYHHEPVLAHGVLKLVTELATNRSQRLSTLR